MSDARAHLARAQTELARGAHQAAYRAFSEAARAFSGPTQLLGGGHAWLGLAQVNLLRGQHDATERAVSLAEQTYRLGLSLLEGISDPAAEALLVELREGLARCQLLRAEQHVQRGQIARAREALEVLFPLYASLGERPGVADLHTFVARLAEREGRWKNARSAWERALAIHRANGDEQRVCDALIRAAEANLHLDDLAGVEDRLGEAERLARELDDPALVARARIAHARLLELQQEHAAAWERWLDAREMLARTEDRRLRGLASLRMAAVAARSRPDEALGLLQYGFAQLHESGHPDAVGLTLHQLAVVSLALERAELALLAAIGAARAREPADTSIHPVLYRVLVQLDHLVAACLLAHLRHRRRPAPHHERSIAWLRERLPDWEEPTDIHENLHVELDRIAGPLARRHGLPLSQIGTARAVTVLTASAPTRPNTEKRPVLTWSIREGETLRYPLTEGTHLLGRGGDNAVRMAWDPMASRTHCALDFRDGALLVRDLGSQHGVYVGERRVQRPTPIRAEERLTVGQTVFRVVWELPGASVQADSEDGGLPGHDGGTR